MSEREWRQFLLSLRGISSTRDRPVRVWRGGGRDSHQWISELHRQWGWDLPAVDLDEGLVMVEGYDFKAVALIDYKNPQENRATRFQRAVLCDLVRPGLPVFEVIASELSRTFDPHALNECAEGFLRKWQLGEAA